MTLTTSPPRTLFDKIWAEHIVMQRDDGQSLLYVDCHLVQDGSAPAFEMLRQKGLRVRTPERASPRPTTMCRPTRARSIA